MELLFETRLDIVRVVGQFNFLQIKPYISEEPVLVGDSYVDERGLHIYGSVLKDQGIYRMWYAPYASPDFGSKHDTALVAYAESDDGIHWNKKILRMVDCGGFENNLCNLSLASPTIFIDPDAPPSHRYRATGSIDARYKGFNHKAKPPMGGSYYMAHSSDGLNWELDQAEPTWRGADDICSIFHPGRGHAQVMMKQTCRRGGVYHRAWAEAKIENGVPSRYRQAMIPNEYDDIMAVARGGVSGDYNNMGLMPAGKATVAFIQQHAFRLPYIQHPKGNCLGMRGKVDVSLSYQSEEGACWTASPGRPNFISHGDASWAKDCIFTSGNVETFGDEQRLYISGRNMSHGSGTHHENNSGHMSYFDDKIGYVSWPKWRLFGFHADPEGELEIDLGCIKEISQLALNYEVLEECGYIGVELYALDNKTHRVQEGTMIAKRSKDDAIKLTGNSLYEIVRWNEGLHIDPVENCRIIARLCMYRSKVYAFKVTPIS